MDYANGNPSLTPFMPIRQLDIPSFDSVHSLFERTDPFCQ
jgi:hypothetical protein